MECLHSKQVKRASPNPNPTLDDDGCQRLRLTLFELWLAPLGRGPRGQMPLECPISVDKMEPLDVILFSKTTMHRLLDASRKALKSLCVEGLHPCKHIPGELQLKTHTLLQTRPPAPMLSSMLTLLFMKTLRSLIVISIWSMSSFGGCSIGCWTIGR